MTTLTDEDLTALLEGEASSYDVPPHGPAEVLSTLAILPAPVPLVRRRWLQLSAAAAAMVVAVVAMGAVSGSGDDNADMTAAGSGREDTAGYATGGTTGGTAPQAPAKTGSGASWTGSTWTGSTPQESTAQPPAAFPGQVTGGQGSVGAGTGPAAAPDGADSRVVKTGTITLVADDKQVSSVLGAVQRAATTNGGYVSSSTSNEYGDTPSGQVTIRVPVARFEALVAAIRGLDAEVRTATTSGKDVTAEYADIEAQLRTLRATRERFLVILGQTKTINEILSVQQRVDNVSGQIDRLEGSRKLLASQSDLSTLTVSVSEEGDPVVRVEENRDGFGQALRDAKDGFLNGVEAMIRHSGTVLLWVLVLAVAFAVGRGAWKVARRRLV